MTTTLSRIPDMLAVAAHRALHTQWQLPGQSLPDSGTGCPECLPDIRIVLAPLWTKNLDLAAVHPVMSPALVADPAYAPLVATAATTLHHIWSPGVLAPREHCTDCRDDIEVIFDGIWPLLTGKTS